MQTLDYELKEWTLNTIYDKIYNCRVVKPTYEVNWLYSNKFMLDKRLWTQPLLSKPWYIFTDVVKIKWIKYYLANNWTKSYIIHEDWTEINSWINIDSSSPIRMVTTKWAWWNIITSWTFTESSLALDTTNGTNDWWAYVKMKVPWCTAGQYIVFKDWLLKWWTNRIEYVNAWYIYIIWTNTRWTLPEIWQSYVVYETYSETITIWWSDWVYMYNINWNNTVAWILLLQFWILDLTIFNWQLMLLTDRGIWFSKSTFDWNTNVYPRDLLKWYTWKSLINLWTSLLAIGDKDKSELIKDIRSTDWSIWFVSHQLELTSRIFSKYSYVHKDWIFLLLTDKNRMPIVNIQNINNTLSKTVLNYTDSMFKWLFSNVSDNVYANEDWTFVHFINQTWGKTQIYELDFEYRHWIIQTYDFLIYKKEDWEILWTDWVYSVWWYDDLWVEYSQEINFSSWNTLDVIQPYKYIRTVIWITWWVTDITLEIKLELWAKIKTLTKQFKNYEFDNITFPNIWDLIWYDNIQEEIWTIAALQQPILLSGRYARYKYTSQNRLILWDTRLYIETQESKVNNEKTGN